MVAPHPGGDGRSAQPAVSTLIAAERWVQAAALLRAWPPVPEEWSAIGVYRNCVADWFSHLGGDRTATARLQVIAAAPVSEEAAICASVLSELEPERRVQWLSDKRNSFSSRWSLGAAAGVFDYDPLHIPEEILLRPDDADRGTASLWLPPAGDKPWQRAVALRWKAVKQVIDNDPEAALATAKSLRVLADEIRAADRTEDYHFNLRPIDALVPAIQLYTPVMTP
jgi:hypothetical protein